MPETYVFSDTTCCRRSAPFPSTQGPRTCSRARLQAGPTRALETTGAGGPISPPEFPPLPAHQIMHQTGRQDPSQYATNNDYDWTRIFFDEKAMPRRKAADMRRQPNCTWPFKMAEYLSLPATGCQQPRGSKDRCQCSNSAISIASERNGHWFDEKRSVRSNEKTVLLQLHGLASRISPLDSSIEI